MTSAAANSHEDLCIFFISRSILLKIINVLVKKFRENQKKHFVLDNFFSEIIGKNMVVVDRTQ
jgi:hypothetical protein